MDVGMHLLLPLNISAAALGNNQQTKPSSFSLTAPSRGLGSGCRKARAWRRQMGCCQPCLLHQVLGCSCVGSVLWLHRAGTNCLLAIAASLDSPASDMLESKGRYTRLCSFFISFHLPFLISPFEAGFAVSKEVWSISETSFILKRSPENFPLDTAMWNHTSERAPVLQSDMLIIFTFLSLNIFQHSSFPFQQHPCSALIVAACWSLHSTYFSGSFTTGAEISVKDGRGGAEEYGHICDMHLAGG